MLSAAGSFPEMNSRRLTGIRTLAGSRRLQNGVAAMDAGPFTAERAPSCLTSMKHALQERTIEFRRA